MDVFMALKNLKEKIALNDAVAIRIYKGLAPSIV
jgi:hypothetical protein